MPDLPRVLVVTSNTFTQTSGGGITLTNLFRGWPADRLANLHEDPAPEDRAVCRIFYRLSAAEIRWTWPFSLVQRRPPGDGRGTGALALSPDAGGVRRLARWLLGDGVPRTARISRELDAWLDAFRPELVYGFLGSMAQIRLVRELAQRLAVPVAVHIMDDWPTVLYRGGLLAPALRRIVQRELGAILGAVSLRLGISPEMCEEYRRRYGHAFLPFHNALDMAEWERDARRDWTGGTPFVVRYVGSIVPDGQRDALREVADAVAALRASGTLLELSVHAPPEQTSYLARHPACGAGLRLAGPPEPDGIRDLLASADLLVLPFNFDARSARYIRLSMPTKVPAYMASGAPILVYAPPETATARYARREGWAHVVAEPGLAGLREALGWLVRDQATRERLGRRALALARERHDAARVRPAFWAALTAAAAHGRPAGAGVAVGR